jgi:hypothetical protein
LLEFAEVIGMDLPARLLVFILGAANLYRYAVNRAVVRAPHCAEDYRSVLGGEPLPGVGGYWDEEKNRQAGKRA